MTEVCQQKKNNYFCTSNFFKILQNHTKFLAVKYLIILIFSTVFFSLKAQDLNSKLEIYSDNLVFLRRLDRAFSTSENNVFANGIFVPKTKIGKKGMSLILSDVKDVRKVLEDGEGAFDQDHLSDLIEINQKIETLKVTLVSRAIFVVFLDTQADELGFLKFGAKRKLKKAVELVPKASAEDLRELWGDSANELDTTIQGVIEAINNY